MSAVRFVPLIAAIGALAVPGAALAQDPIETSADQTACNATVWIGSGSVQSGSYTFRTPEQTVRLAIHTGELGEQDPCAA